MGDSAAFATPLQKQIKVWLGEADDLTGRLADLRKKVDAARFLLGGDAGPVASSPALNSKAAPGASAAGQASGVVPLTAAIAKLMADGRVRVPASIRRELAAGGRADATLTTRNGHFYGLLREMVSQGKLLRDGDRYRDAAAAKAAAKPRDGADASDVTARVMGDPAPGRSALAQRSASGTA